MEKKIALKWIVLWLLNCSTRLILLMEIEVRSPLLLCHCVRPQVSMQLVCFIARKNRSIPNIFQVNSIGRYLEKDFLYRGAPYLKKKICWRSIWRAQGKNQLFDIVTHFLLLIYFLFCVGMFKHPHFYFLNSITSYISRQLRMKSQEILSNSIKIIV